MIHLSTSAPAAATIPLPEPLFVRFCRERKQIQDLLAPRSPDRECWIAYHENWKRDYSDSTPIYTSEAEARAAGRAIGQAMPMQPLKLLTVDAEVNHTCR